MVLHRLLFLLKGFWKKLYLRSNMSDSLMVPEIDAFVHLKSKNNELKKELDKISKSIINFG